jgi:hypothetical protein
VSYNAHMSETTLRESNPGPERVLQAGTFVRLYERPLDTFVICMTISASEHAQTKATRYLLADISVWRDQVLRKMLQESSIGELSIQDYIIRTLKKPVYFGTYKDFKDIIM